MSGESVYVDISAMNSWQSNVKEIASTNESIINELKSIISSVDGSWQGNSATAFTEGYTNFLNELSSANSNLGNFSGLLQTVVQTMENE